MARTRRAYEDHLEQFLDVWSRRPYRRPPLLRNLLREVPRKARLLDLGCGAGQDSGDLRRAGFRPVGVDLSRPLLQYARRMSPGLALVQADIRRLPYHIESFDGVWAAASLIHLPKSAVRIGLKELAMLVKPGGVLTATFVHGRGSGLRHSGWIPGRFMSRWYKQELACAVVRAGWTILQLTTVSNQERKGRWLNLMARRPYGQSLDA